MRNKLTTMAQELLAINDDIQFRFKDPYHTTTKDFKLYDFDQTWPSTALGFGGMGGQAITTVRTYVLIPIHMNENCYVYFAGEFAYAVPYSAFFMKDVREGRMRPVRESGYYIRMAKEQFAVDNEDYMK